jgi:nucleoid-associated protein YgaU
MGCVQQAVLEFDEEVQVPWRPRLVPAPDVAAPPAPLLRRQSSRQSSSRVGVCRPAVPLDRAPVPNRRARPDGRRAVPGVRPVPGESGGFGAVARPRSTRVRLTRRARRLAVVLALCGGVVLGSWMGPFLAGDGGEGLRLAGERSVVVQSGDTLWSLAASVAGGDDVRMVVDRIQELNGLEGVELVPGQVLQLP